MNRAIACAGLVALSTCTLLYGQPNCLVFGPFSGLGGVQTISVLANDPAIPLALIDGAISRWNNCVQASCSYGESPWLLDDCGGDITFEIIHEYMNPEPYCGWMTYSTDANGNIIGGRITLYDLIATGYNCVPGRERTLAHEIGHGLGLWDTLQSLCSNWGAYLMGPRGGAASPNSQECAAVNMQWDTFFEQQMREWDCEQFCYGNCEQDHNGQWQCIDGQPSPIIVDVGGDGYHLTGVADGVLFDLDGDGNPENTSWTSDGSDAFLCFDLDHDGRVTSGRELFGNYTIVPGRIQAENGFVALGWYDGPGAGGNANGWIDSGDVIWGLLRLWSDTNHDGVSQPNELVSLDAAGVVGISTSYHEGRRRDGAGNRFRYRGVILIQDANMRVHPRQTYDVFLVADN
jgi:hypothetical protein